MKKLSIALLFLFIVTITINAQNPPNINWKKIKTEHYEIIFPEEIASKAQEVANKLENIYFHDSRPLKTNPKPISVVLYNQSTVSNAYARLAPRMMGWYTTPYPSSGLGITNWTTTLAIHENRHVVQYSKLNNNFTKIASIFFGQYGQAVMQFISMPNWYFEGDAIYAETVLSDNGRGRVTSFNMPIRTIQMSDNKRIKYDKALFGSYKTYYPNHYYLGYNMVTHINRNYGEESWNKILNRTTLFSFWPFSFSRSLKKYTGYNIRKTYDNTMSELDSIWEEQIKDIEFTEAKIVNTKEKKSWTSYNDLEYIDDDNILILKTSLDKATTITKLNLTDGTETSIVEVGSPTISYASNKLAVKKTYPDIRYTERTYSDIIVVDFATNEVKRITKKQKYFAPNVSPDGKQVVVVEYTPEQECSIVLINSETGEVNKTFKSPDNEYVRTPEWSQDGEKIVFMHNSDYGEAMSYLDIKSGKYFELIPHGWERVGSPVFYNDYVIYNSDYSGIGNIYAIDINSKQKFQITSRKFGAYNAEVSPDNKKMLFQDYTVDGFDIAEITLQPENWIKITDVKIIDNEYFATTENRNKLHSKVKPDSIPNVEYEVKKYNKFFNAINIHSWVLQPSINENLQPESIQLSVFSDNKLNTLILESGINLSTYDNSVYGYAKASYQKYFPIFDITTMYGNRALNYSASNDIEDKDSIDIWQEANISAGFSIPLNLSRKVFSTYLTFGTYANYKHLHGKEFGLDEDNTIGNGHFGYMNYFMNFSRIKRKAFKDINTPFGQSINISFRHILLSENWNGYKFSAVGNFYFPSFIKHHSIKIHTAFEKQLELDINSTNIYSFSHSVAMPRGYDNYYLLDEIYKASIDYQLPLFYPDFGINPLIYFKRVRLNIFYDYVLAGQNESLYDAQSTGAQLLLDFHVLRLEMEFNVGVQWAYLINGNEHKFKGLLLGIEF